MGRLPPNNVTCIIHYDTCIVGSPIAYDGARAILDYVGWAISIVSDFASKYYMPAGVKRQNLLDLDPEIRSLGKFQTEPSGVSTTSGGISTDPRSFVGSIQKIELYYRDRTQ